MQPAGSDADLGAHAELAAVGELRRGVVQDDGAVQPGQEALGRLAERHSRDLSFLLGIGLFTVASAACAFAGNIEALIAFRVAQAAGAALMTPTSLGLLLFAGRVLLVSVSHSGLLGVAMVDQHAVTEGE